LGWGLVSRPPRAAIAAALIAVYFFWGSTFIGIRYAIDTLPPYLMAGVRFALAGLILLAFARLRHAPRSSRRALLAAAGTGVVMLVAGNGVVVWAEQTVPTGLVALTVSTSPIWMVLADRIFFGARITWPAAVGIGIGLLGIVVLVNPSTAVIPILSTLVLVVGSVGWTAGTILTRSGAMPESNTVTDAMQMLGGGAAFLLIALAVGDPGRLDVDRVSATSLAGLAWLIVFGSLIGFSCYLWLIRVAPIPLVATQSYVSPVVAVVLGALLRQESLTPRELVAGAVIIAGVVLVASAPLLTSRRSAKELKAA
jgi:drug/metabolite transporter (DMT)-like permease